MNRQIEIEGYGTIVINPINFKDKEYESVDLEGKPLKWVAGKMAKTGYFVNEDGLEVPISQVCKKVNIEGEDILIQKFKPTSKIQQEDIEITDGNEDIYTSIERKPYKVFTENKRLKEMILDNQKTLKFPLVVGSGYKIYNGILTNWKGQIILCGCRGNINEVLKKYEDDAVDIEIETIIQKPNTKKLLKALSV